MPTREERFHGRRAAGPGPVPFDQAPFATRCEWGLHGVSALAPTSDVIIVVDVLSFSTCVEIAVHRGARVFPYRWKDDRAGEFAAALDADLARPERSQTRYSLSPESLTRAHPGDRIVLPSPNGATLSLAAHPTPVLAGCLRNARAVAIAAQELGPRVSVIPAGERWADDQHLRPAFEDLVGAGAIISYLSGACSPEAASAAAAFRQAEPDLAELLRQSGSGVELITRGFPQDVDLASQLDVSDTVPILVEGAFEPQGNRR